MTLDISVSVKSTSRAFRLAKCTETKDPSDEMFQPVSPTKLLVSLTC